MIIGICALFVVHFSSKQIVKYMPKFSFEKSAKTRKNLPFSLSFKIQAELLPKFQFLW